MDGLQELCYCATTHTANTHADKTCGSFPGYANVLEDVFWEERHNTNCTKLTHLGFADNIILLAGNISDFQYMVEKLQTASKKKIPSLVPNIILGNSPIDSVDDYIYVGHCLSLDRKWQGKKESQNGFD